MTGLAAATIKLQPADFFVSEILGRRLSGAGEHAYFFVEKTRLNTDEVVAEIAQAYGVGVQDVGYAGRKDKQAVTRQWFSVPVGSADDAPAPWRLLHSQLRCLARTRHAQKLRRGQLQGNLFGVRLRLAQPEPVAVSALRDTFANRFGPQRFGGNNLRAAQDWLAHRRQRRVSRGAQGWHLSVLRSYLFNEVITRREQEGGLDPLPGDVLQDGVATGPLWGRGRSATSGLALQIEQAALAPHQDICDELEYTGVSQGRRPLVARVAWLAGHYPEPYTLELKFALPAGTYATTFLSAWFDLKEGSVQRCRHE